jgi:hypothetical protein
MYIEDDDQMYHQHLIQYQLSLLILRVIFVSTHIGLVRVKQCVFSTIREVTYRALYIGGERLDGERYHYITASSMHKKKDETSLRLQ